MTHEETEMAAFYVQIPDDQLMTYSVEPIEGALLRASFIGGHMRAVARLMKSCGDAVGEDVDVFIVGISMHEKGGISFKLAVLPKLPSDTAPMEA